MPEGIAISSRACADSWETDAINPLARLETGEGDRDLRPRNSKAQQHSIPTARQKALWENVQQARLRGLSLRAIARELGIHRNTARKYALANSPPLRSISGTTGTP